MPPAKLPVDNSMTSFWRSEPLPLDNHRSTPELPASADIVVIGSGYAGASTVYHMQKLCEQKGRPLPSVVVLEARQACSGATGRNGGHLKPDPYNRPATLAARHGVAAASEVASFEAAHIKAVQQAIEAEGIDCDFVLTRCCDVMLQEPIYARIKAGVQMLRENQVPVMEEVFFAEGRAAEQLSGVKGAKGCFTYPTGHLWPYKLVHGLLAKAVAAGVNLQTNTPVTAVADDSDSDSIVVTTPRGTVRARQVVYATNAYTSAILPEYAGKIVPVRGICSHIAPPAGSGPSPLLGNSYILRSSPTAYEYLVPRLDGSIVVGGGRSEYLADLASWYDNADDSQLIAQAAGYFDGFMQRTFRGWDDTGAATTRVWSGIMGYSVDSLPHIGAVPGRPGHFILAGFSGHGMPQVFLSAKGVAAMVLEDVAFEETGVPRLFQTTQARLDSTRNVVLESYEENKDTPPMFAKAA